MNDETAPQGQMVPFAKRHAAAAARMHQAGIRTGFLSSLGQRFLKQLYIGIAACPAGFGHVWENSDGELRAFLVNSEDTGKLYKQALKRRGFWMGLALLKFIFRPSVIRHMWNTLRYPAQVGDDVPKAEMLSIAVAEELRRHGIGKALMDAGAAEFKRRGISRIKGAVWAKNEASCGLCLKMGYKLLRTIEYHGKPTNIFVLDLNDLP